MSPNTEVLKVQYEILRRQVRIFASSSEVLDAIHEALWKTKQAVDYGVKYQTEHPGAASLMEDNWALIERLNAAIIRMSAGEWAQVESRLA